MAQKRKATKRATPKGPTKAQKKQEKEQRKLEQKKLKRAKSNKQKQKRTKNTTPSSRATGATPSSRSVDGRTTSQRGNTSGSTTSRRQSLRANSQGMGSQRTKASTQSARTQLTKASAQASGSKRTNPSTAQTSQKKRKPLIVRIFLWLLGIVAALLITVLILAMTPLFTIEHVDYITSEHVTAEDLEQLAPIQDGTTLLSVNPFVLNAELKKNPWVESVVLERDFPSTLKISVNEKKVLALVETANAEVAWYLGADKTWIEPAALPTGEGANNAESILSLATSSHTLLIKDVPDSLNPKAGASVTDEEVLGALQFNQDFSADLSDTIALYSAPNTASYSATLQSGVVIALGDTSDIPSKEAVILALLEKHPNQLTYINVKDPSKPTYRKIENTQTTTGTGVTK